MFTSTAISGPVVVGLLRPRVILPGGLAESIASDQLRDILIHEGAHVVRRDAWVGLLQRLTSAFFWPHPLVHYASGELTRAREELCDNHVLRHGDRRDYARTLLDLTERYLPLGAARPGLGLLGTRWTLADRVAGLLDTRRLPMTRTTIRMRLAVCILLGVTVLAASGVHPVIPLSLLSRVISWLIRSRLSRYDRRTRSGTSKVPSSMNRACPCPTLSSTHENRPIPLRTVGRRWRVHTVAQRPAALCRGLIAETNDGSRIGLTQFSPPRPLGATTRCGWW